MYFENIIGQDFAKKYIINSIKKDRINNAYIFEGIEGIGKTTFSYEFAKILLEREDIKNSPDFINIYPEDKNSIKISQIRELISDIIIKPHSNKKVYIIHNSETMTLQSQNALLKTLEEPPSYAIIILITTNKESIIDTIKSRCDIIKFVPISTFNIEKYLDSLGIKNSSIIANFSRDSIGKALELSSSDKFRNIREDVCNYIENILKKDLLYSMDNINSIDIYKNDIITVMDILITFFRDVMMLKQGINNIINIDKMSVIQSISKEISSNKISKIIDIIEDIKNKLNSNCSFSICMQVMFFNIYEVII